MTVVLVALSVCLTAQQSRDVVKAAATGTAQISGTVVSADTTPVPIRRAIVFLKGDTGTQLEAVTDDAGVFAFTSLPADRYSLTASKGSYVPASYGSKRPGGSGTPIVVSAGQRVTAPIRLLKGSVITGTVRDEEGRPMPGVSVSVLQYVVSFRTGQRTLESVTIGSAGLLVPSYAADAFPGSAATDDRGMYRIYGLAPGQYIISATPRSQEVGTRVATDVHQVTAADVQRAERLLRGPANWQAGVATDRADVSRVDWAPVYHPAALSATDAATITLAPAEERSGVDVALRLVPTATVTVVVTAPDGSPMIGGQVSIMDPAASNERVLRTGRGNEDGEFVIPSIPPGRYQIQASLYAARLFGAAEVTVAGQNVSVPLTLSSGHTLAGRVVFDGASRPPSPDSVTVILSRDGFVIGQPALERSPDGRFQYTGIPPGRYRLIISGRPPAGWVLRSSMVNGVDASEIPLDIKPGGGNLEGATVTLTDRPAEISGVLQTAAGQPAPEYGLVVFSADERFQVPRSRRTQYVRPDITGRFIVRDLPAGDYLISAVTDIDNGQWNDPSFLAALAASSPIKVSVAEGEKKVQDIRIGGG